MSQFLVQRINVYDEVTTSIMGEQELINYVDRVEDLNEEFRAFNISEYGKVERLIDEGWTYGRLVKLTNEAGELVVSGYPED